METNVGIVKVKKSWDPAKRDNHSHAIEIVYVLTEIKQRRWLKRGCFINGLNRQRANR